MDKHIPHFAYLIIGCVVIVLTTSVIMFFQARNFIYQIEGVNRKFSIMNFEWPSTRDSISKLIHQINASASSKRIAIKALKGQLYMDFIFMIGVYPGIGLLCFSTAFKYPGFLQNLLLILAAAQLLAWCCDIGENIFIFSMIAKPRVMPAFGFVLYRLIEIIKWSFSCIGFLFTIVLLIIKCF